MTTLLNRRTTLGRWVAITLVGATISLGVGLAAGPQVAAAGGPPCRSPIPGDTTGPPKTIRAVTAGAELRLSRASLSADGQLVAYVAGPPFGDRQAFVRDLVTEQSSVVSVSPGGDPIPTGLNVAMSASGDTFAFRSEGHAYVNSAGSTMQLPISGSYPAVSASGRYVALEHPDPDHGRKVIAVVDTLGPDVSYATAGFDGSRPDGRSNSPSISADGRFVAFESWASNLVPGDTNGEPDVFVYDRSTGTTTRVSQSATGVGGNRESRAAAISADGRFVAFDSWSSNLVPGDTNHKADVFVYEMGSGTLTNVSLAPRTPYVGSGSVDPSISADGRYVAFESRAPNLVPGDTNGESDVFVHDRVAGTTIRASVTATGAQGNGRSWTAAISADGHWVSFSSEATNLIGTGRDTNEADDIFLRGPLGFDSTDLPPCVPDRFDRDDPALTPPESRPNNDIIERATHLGGPGVEPELEWQPVKQPGLEQWELQPASMPEGLDAEPLNFHTRIDEDWFVVTAMPEALTAQCAPAIEVDAPSGVYVSIMMRNPLTGEMGEVASSRSGGGRAAASGFRIGDGEIVIRFQRADPQAPTFELVTYEPTITYSDVPTSPVPGACL